MKEIKLTQGKIAIVDDSDYELVIKFQWFVVKAKNTFYAATWVGPWREREMVRMHHLIVGKPANSIVIDHRDRNGLNNCRTNLREGTRGQNSANRTPSGSSKYLGVSRFNRKSGVRWRAFVGNKYLGVYGSEEDAAIAYNNAAREAYGEFANLNIIEPSVITAEYDAEVGAMIVS